MNILCSVNERFIRQFKCMIFSLAESQSEPVDIYFINSSLTSYQIKNLKKYTEALDLNFYEIVPEKNLIDKIQEARKFQLNEMNRSFSLECFLRVFSHIILPCEITRVLWIDADCIVQKDISHMYNYNLFNNIGFATIDCYELDIGQHDYVVNSVKAPLGLTEEDIMFNSGVILLNLKRMRELEEFRLDNLINLLQEHPELRFDQDILNFLCKGQMIINGELEFNYPPNWSSYDDIQRNIREKSILHYYGIQKPWLETTNTPYLGVFPWKKYEKMSQIIDKLIGTRYL